MLLAINTVTDKVELNLWDLESKSLINSMIWEKDQNESEKILPNIVTILNQKNLNLADLKQILVINGPGSFVSLRLGVLIANTLAKNLKDIELFSLNTFEYLSLAESDLVILDAGGTDLYIYNCNLKNFEIISLNQALEKIKNFKNQTILIESKFKEKFKIEKIKEKLSLEQALKQLIRKGYLKDFKITNPPLEVNYVKNPSIQMD